MHMEGELSGSVALVDEAMIDANLANDLLETGLRVVTSSDPGAVFQADEWLAGPRHSVARNPRRTDEAIHAAPRRVLPAKNDICPDHGGLGFAVAHNLGSVASLM